MSIWRLVGCTEMQPNGIWCDEQHLYACKKTLYLFFIICGSESELINAALSTPPSVSLLTSGGRACSPICGAGAVEYM